jgi:hypothetical protein
MSAQFVQSLLLSPNPDGYERRVVQRPGKQISHKEVFGGKGLRPFEPAIGREQPLDTIDAEAAQIPA